MGMVAGLLGGGGGGGLSNSSPQSASSSAHSEQTVGAVTFGNVSVAGGGGTSVITWLIFGLISVLGLAAYLYVRKQR